MTLKKVLSILSFIVILLSSQAIAKEEQPVYSLDMLYQIAIRHSESIKISEEDLFMAKQDRKRALSVLCPTFTAFGSYSTEEADLTENITPDNPASPLSSDISQTSDTTTWGVRFDQSFTLNGKELTALKISADKIETSEFNLTTAKEDYLFQVASAYYGVLQAAKAKEIGNANVKRLKKHKNSVEARLKLEDVTRTDMYRAKANLSDAYSQYIDAVNSLKSARATLKSLVDIPNDFLLALPDKKDSSPPVDSLYKLLPKGLHNRAEIKSYAKQHEIAKKNIKYTKGAYWPKLSLEGQYVDNEITSDGTNTAIEFDKESEGTAYSVKASLAFTIFDGGLRRADVKKAAADKRRAKYALIAEKKRIKLEIENSFLDVETQKSKLTALADKLKFSRQTYKAVSEQFKHGLSNSVDMMDSNTDLVSAERELSNAEYKYKLALLKLKKVTGTFLEETVSK